MGSWNRVGRLALPSILLLTFLLKTKKNYFNCSRRPLLTIEKNSWKHSNEISKNGEMYSASARRIESTLECNLFSYSKTTGNFFNILLADDTKFHLPVDRKIVRQRSDSGTSSISRCAIGWGAVTQVAFSLTSSKRAAEYLISRDPLLDISCQDWRWRCR